MNFVGPYSDYPPAARPISTPSRHTDIIKNRTSQGFPIAWDDLLLDLRVDSTDELPTIKRMARAAAAFLEKRTGIAVLQGVYEAKFTDWCFYGPWEFHRTPLRSIKEISYLDGTASPPTWTDVSIDDFFVDVLAKSFLMVPLQTFQAPTIWAPFNGIRVRFLAGYDVELQSGEDPIDQESDGGPGADDQSLEIADDVRTTLTMLVAHYYQNRELFAADKIAEIEMGAGAMLAGNRQFW